MLDILDTLIVSLSNNMKGELNGEDEVIGAIGRTIMRWQDATKDFDEAFGRLHG